eukprot:4581761-Amphidinium_carterae.1
MQETSSSATTSSSKRIADGTYRYMSPERLRDSNSDTPAADIYAFAMVMVSCLVGRLALLAPSDGRVPPPSAHGLNTDWLIRIYAGERPALPIGIRDLHTYKTHIEECWDGDPTQRPSSDV